MRVLVQRVSEASVKVGNKVVGKIDQGLLLFVCFEKEDTDLICQRMAKKVLNLRIFEDNQRKMNKNVTQVNAKILSISQFTLSWPGKKGNRPSFSNSMNPDTAQIFYETFNRLLKDVIQIQEGLFGKDMKVSLVNDGPVTFMLES